MIRSRSALAIGAALWVSAGGPLHAEPLHALRNPIVAPSSPAPGESAAPLPVGQQARAEAAWRFDRGVELYNVGDFPGARAEFQRAFELTRHVVVQLNLGLVQAKLGNSVEAVRLLEPLAGAAPGLDDGRRGLAANVAAEHRGRLGTLHVETNVEDAIIQLDNVEVAKTPAPPIAVAAGSHLVSVFAPDYEPRRLEVVVPSRATQRVSVELMPLQETLAHLDIESETPDVDVFAGGVRLGRTPFDSSVAFKPGVHELRFERPGYVAQTRRVELHPGGSGSLRIRLEPDPASSSRASLRLRVSEPRAVVWVDGQRRPDFERGMSLPLGRHHVRVQRGGFQELTQVVDVGPPGVLVDVELFPTAEGLVDYVERAEAERRWAWVTGGSGALALAGSALFLTYNAEREREAEEAFDRAFRAARGTTSGSCEDRTCEAAVRESAAALDAIRQREPWGWAGVGLGAAALGAGVWLWFRADDPGKYDADGEALASSVTFELEPTTLTVRGTF